MDNSAPEPESKELGGSIDPEGQELPSLPVVLCGAIKRAGGAEALTEALVEGSDLNLAIRRYVAAVAERTDALLGHLTPPKLAEARARAVAGCLHDAEHTNPKNLAAYLTTARKRGTHLGDYIGDDLTAELLKLGKTRGGRKHG